MVSPPMWGCGLKFFAPEGDCGPLCVTPYVGVWIEILQLRPEFRAAGVTPYVGVWIEIE